MGVCSVARLCPTLWPPWTVGHQAPLYMGFSGQEHWNGLPFSPPGNLSDLGIKPVSLVSPVLVGGFFTIAGKPIHIRDIQSKIR